MENTKVVKELQNSIKALSHVLSMIENNSDILLEFGVNIPEHQLNEQRQIKKDLEFYKNKLEKDIIEVAFVGLEKAGKSTLVNAIISKDILPSDYKRATYTTTQIEYSEASYIEVNFYSQDEFLNEVFRKMLKDIKYPNYMNQKLDTISVREFEKYFASLKEEDPTIYRTYENTLRNDIIEILEGKRDIERLLTGEVKKISFEDFDAYKPYITDKYKSRAVKEIKIFTDMLKGLENIIIYDLPGFDSPTFTHSKYTREKIKRADAVVFVREAENPSIRRTEVEIIQETKEDDGVKLKEKVFYFCNMVDKIPNNNHLERIESDFIAELKKYDIFKGKERIIYGSALAKLQKSRQKDGAHAIEGLQRLGLEDGIEELLEKLREYNHTERREILLRRIDALIQKIKNFVESLAESLEGIRYESVAESKYTENILDIIRSSKRNINQKLNDFQYKLKYLLKERNMSKDIKKQLEDIIKFDSILSQEHIENTKKEVERKSSTSEFRPDDFNLGLRNYLYKKVIESLYSTIEKSVIVELDKIKADINNIFIESFSIKNDKKDVFLQNIEKLFKINNINFSLEKFGINKLIERFGGDIIQLLVQNPLTSTDRYYKFKEVEKELYSLIAYHKDFNPHIPPVQMSILKNILYQANSSITNINIDEKLKSVLKTLGIELSNEEYSEIIRILSKSNNPIEVLSKVEKNKFIRSPRTLKSAIRSEIDEETEMVEENKTEDEDFRLSVLNKRPLNYDDVLKEIKIDMENLQGLISDCIINAINIEKIVVNQVTSYINILIEVLNKKEFDDFVNNNISIIKPELQENTIRLRTKGERVNRIKEDLEKSINLLKEGGNNG